MLICSLHSCLEERLEIFGEFGPACIPFVCLVSHRFKHARETDAYEPDSLLGDRVARIGHLVGTWARVGAAKTSQQAFNRLEVTLTLGSLEAFLYNTLFIGVGTSGSGFRAGVAVAGLSVRESRVSRA